MTIKGLNYLKGQPDLNSFINRNNELLNEFLDVYRKDIPPPYSDVMGTSIPYVYNMLGSWLLNPSTVSISTLQRMSYIDSVISSSLEYNTAIISNTVGDFYHENKEIQKFVRKAFDNLDEGKSGLIRDMLTSMWAGFYVGEKEYSKPSEYIDGKIWIKSVVGYPPSSVLFRVTRTGQLDDFVYQYVYFAQNPGIQNNLSYIIPGYGFGPEYGQGNLGYNAGAPDGIAFIGDADYPLRTTQLQTVGMIPVPRKKVIHYFRKGQDGFINPYGRSMLRSVYNFYILKCAFLQFLAIVGDRKSTPLLVGYVDPASMGTNTQINVQNPDPALNSQQSAQTAMALLTECVSRLRGDSALLVPGMKGTAFDFEAVDIGANLNVFTDTLRYCDDSIQQGLLYPASMLGGGAGQSYASGTSQNSIHNKLLSSTRSSISRKIITDFVSDLILFNFPESAHKNEMGYFESELLNTEDKTNIIKLYETMRATGLTGPSLKEDINKYRQLVGDSELTDSQIKEIEKHMEEQNMSVSDKNTGNKTDVKESDAHYKKQNDKPKGGSSV